MAISQAKSKRSPAGSKYKDHRKKKQFELGRAPALTKIAEKKLKKVRIIGGNTKQLLLSSDVANVHDQITKKTFKSKIKGVLENPANRHYVRRSILTKGTVIETEKGKAKVTSRPGQEGTVNAILIKE